MALPSLFFSFCENSQLNPHTQATLPSKCSLSLFIQGRLPQNEAATLVVSLGNISAFSTLDLLAPRVVEIYGDGCVLPTSKALLVKARFWCHESEKLKGVITYLVTENMCRCACWGWGNSEFFVIVY